MQDPDFDDEDHDFVDATADATAQAAQITPSLTVDEILADVDPSFRDEDDVGTTNEDEAVLARIDTYVRSVLAGATPRLDALNAALGHNLPLPPLNDDTINAHIAEINAYYYADTSSEDDTDTIMADATAHRPQTPYNAPPSPASPPPTRGTRHDDVTYALSNTSLAPSRSSLPTPIMPTVSDECSSSSVVVPTSSSSMGAGESAPLLPRQLRRYEKPDRVPRLRSRASPSTPACASGLLSFRPPQEHPTRDPTCVSFAMGQCSSSR
jgi:hypothetical protein